MRAAMKERFTQLNRQAEERGHVGAVFTLTVPARFHTMRRGGANPSFAGATPRDGNAWLIGQWAKVRAKLKRMGVRAYGMRVAEPHHDGTPHWHVLLWAENRDDVSSIESVIRDYWRREGEPGELASRVAVVHLTRGASLGMAGEYTVAAISAGAWAAVWGIRPFEAFGDQAELGSKPCA